MNMSVHHCKLPCISDNYGKGCKPTHLILRLRFLCSSSALDNLHVAATEIAVTILQFINFC